MISGSEPELSNKFISQTSWKSFFKPNSLSGRMVILLLTLFILLFTFLAWIIFSISNNYLENVTTRCGKRMATVIEQTLRSSMITENHEEVAIAIRKVKEIPGIEAIRIYNSNGDIRHHTMEPDFKNPLLPCSHCHSENDVDLKQWGMPATCVYEVDEDNTGREMIVLSPIFSASGCRSIGCHETSQDSEVLGFLEIILPLAEMDVALNRVLYQYFAIIAIVFILLMTSIVLFIQYYINLPLNRIVKASRAVTAGNLTVRVNVKPTDLVDIHHVGLALNTMLESINESNRKLQIWSNELENKVRVKSEDFARTQNEIYQIERLASLGRLSSSVAHEINNPLAGVLTYAKLVSRLLQNPVLTDEKKEMILKHLNMIQSETTRCGNIVKGLLNFSRDPNQKFVLIKLNPVLKETEQLIQHSFQISNVKFVTDFSASRDQVMANGNQIIQACLAVLTNALEAVDNIPEGQVTYRTYNQDMNHITIDIKDNGIGIPTEDIEHIFEPFFSRKKEMSGIGLGLAVTYGILEQHKAKIVVDSELGKGTSIKFIFELADRSVDDG
ncbi:MAG: hypothetical protein K9N35_03295 [Candidatus Marinimicrobia bacterium]|nr:hypothetical protein [Candidatus Neomarinimicrobiota bacterium]